MCGIAGIILKNNGSEVSTDVVEKMLDTMAHRGPDAQGMYSDSGVIFGHRRLSIIDTTSAGNQPMHYKDFTIVHNGEIYNYIEIKKRLKKLGHHFITSSDTEVILHAYEEWGETCLNHFTGMWAFAIHDRLQGKIFFSRDRFGIKPFYFWTCPDKFIFASEIKAILSTGIHPQVDMNSLMSYLVIGLEDYSSRTFFKEIKQLLPGQNAILDISNGNIEFYQYYDLCEMKSAEYSSEEYGDRLHDSIALHMRSDVAVGTCLSGGLDSSFVAATASRIFNQAGLKKFSAITARSESSANDEGKYARKVVEFCDLDWITVKPEYKDYAENIEKCLLIHDEPVGNPSVFMQYWVMKAASENGLKVMLDGQGGDESLLGYERYYPAFFWHLFSRGRWLTLVSECALSIKHSKLTVLMLAGYVLYFNLRFLRLRILSKRVDFLKSHYQDMVSQFFQKYTVSFFQLKKMQCSEIMKYQLPHLLRYEDRNSMAWSIEARVPFIEKRCIEAALSLPVKQKIKNGFTKFALRLLAEKILPSDIAWRRNKIGFEAPEQMWFENHYPVMQEKVKKSSLLRKVCRRIPDLKSININTGWKLYNIAVWEEQHKVCL